MTSRITEYRYSLLVEYVRLLFFFFFQAEDGIRDVAVTGVQTCALPILDRPDPAVDREVRRVLRMPILGVDDEGPCFQRLPELRVRHRRHVLSARDEIGRASCRERV